MRAPSRAGSDPGADRRYACAGDRIKSVTVRRVGAARQMRGASPSGAGGAGGVTGGCAAGGAAGVTGGCAAGGAAGVT
ncbi:hypothetical protein, partial [Microbacterium flavum]|uniref:hypothetical protein n=1 Tax=Microbacterium flavum TaxID=415216 RepID=UPI0024ACD243